MCRQNFKFNFLPYKGISPVKVFKVNTSRIKMEMLTIIGLGFVCYGAADILNFLYYMLCILFHEVNFSINIGDRKSVV